jgi:hypothetical protein
LRKAFFFTAEEQEGKRVGSMLEVFLFTGPTLNGFDVVETLNRCWEIKKARNNDTCSQASPEGSCRL